MQFELTGASLQSDVKTRVEAISGETVSACYQCGKCSAGCPAVASMDLLPSQVMRCLQVGLAEDLARSNTPWICASCEVCSVRCPRGIEVARIMEALRHRDLRQRIDRIDIPSLDRQVLREVPPIGLVSAFRKMTS